MILDTKPHLRHDIVMPNGDIIHVSARYGKAGGMFIDETCVFFPNGDSDIRGRYDYFHSAIDELLNA